ncbi:MAG: hypothetical protein DRI97_13510 [Bacteroidetes bacterium]|nr:MAG: hypothetical protein DRI97_13510 [Bacteroidota bacterium]
MARRSSYSFIYNLQRIILLVFFTTTSIGLSIPLAMLVMKLSPNQLYPLVITLLIYMVLVVILGAMIQVISYIPFNLATAFDPIKNDIASGKISTIEQLGERITSFTVQFYNFSFLDITHAYIEIEESGIIGFESNTPLSKVLNEYKMLDKSKVLEDLTLAGKISLPERDYQLYILPIWLGESWLGYMALLSEKKISRFFQRFLMEYEGNFLDDQIMHVVRFNKK